MIDYNTQCADCQEVLSDKRENGKERPWALFKERSMYLAEVYRKLGDEGRAKRVSECSNWLQFTLLPTGKKRLKKASFCRERLCPMCQWRRSLKAAANVATVVENMPEYEFIFLTVTIKNCKADKLGDVISLMYRGWNKLFKQRKVERAFKGYFRSFEVKHNLDRNDYHPHFHALLAVEKSYFKSEDFIKTKELSEMWQNAIGTDYKPHCWLKKVEGNTGKAVAEVAKYAAKSDEYLVDDFDFTCELVQQMSRALKGRRLLGWGGVMAEVRKRLMLEDEEKGDLVHMTSANEEAPGEIITYTWKSGYNQYVKKRH